MTENWVDRIARQRATIAAAGDVVYRRKMTDILTKSKNARVLNLISRYQTAGEFLAAPVSELVAIPGMGTGTLCAIHDDMEDEVIRMSEMPEHSVSVPPLVPVTSVSTGKRMVLQAVERLHDDLTVLGSIVLRGPVFLRNVVCVRVDEDVACVTTRHVEDPVHDENHVIDVSEVIMVTFGKE